MPAKFFHHLKTITRHIAFVTCLLACSFAASSQTTLAAGDIAFIGYITTDDNVNGATQNDEFSFVLLRDIAAGTTINFTDFGWTDGNVFQTANPCGANTGAISDGILLWTAASAMTCGTEVRVRCKFSPTASAGTITPTQATSSNPAAYLSLANGGDQVFAYQGTHAAPAFVAAISINKTWDASLTNCFFSSNSSRLPAGLATANAEITLGVNAKYNCVVTNDLAANIRTAINNNANWNKDNTFTVPIPGGFALPVNCAFNCVQPPVITLDPLSQSLCTGSGVTFTVAADYATSYQWQEFNGGIWTNLTNTGVYSGVTTTTLTISNVAGLDGRQYRAIATGDDPPPATSNPATLTVLASVGGSIAGDASVCIGSNGNLTLSGHTGAVVQWEFSTNGGGSWTTIANTTTSQPYNNITVTTVYRALVQNGACASQYSSTATITVVPLPTVTIGGGGGSHCLGSSVTLTANGSGDVVSYLWSTGATTPTINVTTAGRYTVTVSNSTGCSGAASTEVYIADYVFNGTVDATAPTQNARLFRDGVVNTCAVPKTPVAPVAGTFFYRSHTVENPQSVPVCATVTLFAQGSPSNSNLMAAAYTGSFNPANIHENYAGDAGLSSGIPASVTTFTTTIPANSSTVIVVHETTAGHSGTGNYVLTVDIPRQPASVSFSPSATVCEGTTVLVSGSGANSYAWTPGGATTNSFNVIPPLGNTTYTVTLGYGNFGCTATASGTVTVNPVPTVNITGGGGTHCAGSSVTLTANGSAGVTYLWNTGATTPTINATTAGRYTVTVTNSFGCQAAASTEVYIADYVFNGTVDATAPTQNARLFRDGIINTCAVPKTPVAPVAGTYFYQSHTVTNPQAVPVCATISLFAQGSPSNSNLMVAAYNGSFNPANIHQNYAGDAGLSSGIPAAVTTFTTTIPANASLVVVVHETSTVHSGAGTYVITVDIPRAPVGITTVPGTAVCPGTPVTLTASAANTYAWTPGGATTQAINVTPAVNTTYDVTLGYGNFGCTATASQLITINPPPAFTTQPDNATICDGGNTTFGVVLTGTPPFTYQWQIDQGSGFVNVSNAPPFSGANTATLTVTGANSTYNGAIFRVLIGSGCGNATSNTATLTINPLPTISVVPNGQCSPVTLTATGNSNTYSWSPAAGLNTTTGATVTANPTVNTVYTVTGTLTATGCTNTATATVNATPAAPVVSPSAITICAGAITQLTVTPPAGVSTQWSPATGLFTDASGTIPYVAGTPRNIVYARPSVTATYTATATTATCTSTATSVTITVVQPIAITTQPASQTVCQGATVTFSVVASGTSLSYQWQQNTGSGFTNIANANGTSLVLNNVQTSGIQYRVVISNGCMTVNSNAATLTVNPAPAVTITPLTQRICISDTLVALNATPLGGSWSGIGVSGNNFVPMATGVGTYTLTYTYTNAAGCTSTGTTVARVQDCPERLILLRDNAVTVYPNPNGGRFNIKINSALYNYLGLRVYNAKGELVTTRVFGGLVFGRVIPVDLSHLPGGIYMLHFYYDGGVRSAEKTVQILIAR